DSSCLFIRLSSSLYSFIATPTTEIYTLSLHDALPIFEVLEAEADAIHELVARSAGRVLRVRFENLPRRFAGGVQAGDRGVGRRRDRKSTRLNSSHVKISYAVFCLKKKKKERDKMLDTV